MTTTETPRHRAKRALDFLIGTNGADAGAVFIPREEGRLELFVSNGIDDAAVDRAHALWTVRRESLECGSIQAAPPARSDSRNHVLVPLLDDAALVALVYLDSRSPRFREVLDETSIERFGPVITESVLSPAPDAFMPSDLRSHFARMSAADAQRAHLIAQLEAHEWNIARVGRNMGISRVTVYARMRRFSIPRHRVRKTPRRSES